MLVELGIDLKEWGSVRDSISRAEHTVMGGDDIDPLFHAKLRVASGLVHLAEARYLEAAKAFTSVSPELTNQFNTVISAEDIALFGSLLGLATMDRKGLHAHVIDGVFKGRLELVPTMRETLRHYSKAEYGACLSLLQTTIQHDLLLDIHLHAHVPILLDMIRDRCIVQYFQPYSSVSLAKMGIVFGCSVDEMEEVVAKLIASGGVDGQGLGEGSRINALEKTLCIEGQKEKRERRKVYVRASKMGVEFERNAVGMILRISCIENGVVIQGGSRRGGCRRNRRDPERAILGGPYDSDGDNGSDMEMMAMAMDIDDADEHLVNPNEY